MTHTAALRRILHVDMDAFYASVEQRDDPALRGRPVAVGGAADRRGVVAAASYEARAYGVRSAIPMARAVRLCPDLVIVRPDFSKYRAVSQQVFELFRSVTPLVEPLSLDEAYLDVTSNLCGLPSATATAEEIRWRILAQTGLTASAGISYNKFLAKLGSDQNKPNGQCVITPAIGAAFVETLEIGRFHGIGPKTAGKMNALGIATGADLRRQSLAFLQERFGKAGPWYHAIARGRDDRPVRPDRVRKSSGSETTFAIDLTDPAAIEAAVESQADQVWAWCEKAGAFGRTVTVKIKYADFKQATRSRTLTQPVTAQAPLRQVSIELVRSTFPPQKGIRLLGVTLSNFEGSPEAEGEGERKQLAFAL